MPLPLVEWSDVRCAGPRRVKVQVSAIFCDETEVGAARGGENLRLRLAGVDEEDIQSGFVVCDPCVAVPVVSYFQAQLQVLPPTHTPSFSFHSSASRAQDQTELRPGSGSLTLAGASEFSRRFTNSQDVKVNARLLALAHAWHLALDHSVPRASLGPVMLWVLGLCSFTCQTSMGIMPSRGASDTLGHAASAFAAGVHSSYNYRKLCRAPAKCHKR